MRLSQVRKLLVSNRICLIFTLLFLVLSGNSDVGLYPVLVRGLLEVTEHSDKKEGICCINS